jgi:hypothetical protein
LIVNNEVEEIAKAVKEIRTKEINLKRKYNFDLKFTYWDADDLSFQMKSQGLKFILLKREGGDIAVSCDPTYKHNGGFTVRPDQLVEMFVMGKDAVDKMILVNDVFTDVGGIEMHGLTSPGVDDMEKWCKGMDAEIVRVAKELKKKFNVEQIFKKLWIEMGGSSAKDHDRVVKRIDYIRKMTEAFRQDQGKWTEEMKRVGLK